MTTYQITIAWVDTEEVPAQQIWASDLGRRPKMKTIRVARAAMWTAKGDDASKQSAQTYAKREGGMVFCYPATERDPLGRAKADALAA